MSIAQSMFGEMEHEMANTRRVLERVPMEKADWKPHTKSGTLAWLAGHCAIMPGWGFTTTSQDELDIAGVDSAVPKFTTREGLVILLGVALVLIAMLWLILSGILQVNH